eukprot:SAG31_NODE_183_length_20987_cov_8.711078_23_plen_94_part_00
MASTAKQLERSASRGEVEDDDGHHEVEQILDRKFNAKSKTYEYKVKWLNYPTFEATYVDEQDSFRDDIDDYDARFPRGSLFRVSSPLACMHAC